MRKKWRSSLKRARHVFVVVVFSLDLSGCLHFNLLGTLETSN